LSRLTAAPLFPAKRARDPIEAEELLALSANVPELRLTERAGLPSTLHEASARRTDTLISNLAEQRFLLERAGVRIFKRFARSQHKVQGQAGKVHAGEEHHHHEDGQNLQAEVSSAVPDVPVHPHDDAEPQKQEPDTKDETAENCVFHLSLASCHLAKIAQHNIMETPIHSEQLLL